VSNRRSQPNGPRKRTVFRGVSAAGREFHAEPPATLPRAAVTAATVMLLAFALPISSAHAASCCSGTERFWQRCAVARVTADSIVLRFAGAETTRTFALGTVPLQNAARSLRRPGDALVMVGEVGGAKSLQALGVRVSRGLRVVVMLSVVAALLLLAALLLPGGPRLLALGEDGPYSSSKWQMLVWFGVVVVAYSATLVLRGWAGGAAFVGGVDVPVKLLILSGLSALTFATARIIRQYKENRAPNRTTDAAPTGDQKSDKDQKRRARFPADLIRDGSGPPDLARFQMVVVTTLAVVGYLIRVFACLGQVELVCATSLPDVDAAILAGVGISQGAYLARKAVAKLEK